MTRLPRRYRWRVVGAGVLVGVVAGWAVWRLTVPRAGSLDDVFARVRVGMSREEVTAALQTCDNIDCTSVSGTTRDGRSFSSIGSFNSLPPAQEIEHGELSVGDDDGHSVDVLLGRGGVVAGKRFDPHEPYWEYSLRRLRRAADSDLSDLRRVRRALDLRRRVHRAFGL